MISEVKVFHSNLLVPLRAVVVPALFQCAAILSRPLEVEPVVHLDVLEYVIHYDEELFESVAIRLPLDHVQAINSIDQRILMLPNVLIVIA
jgi:hypothetical protein